MEGTKTSKKRNVREQHMNKETNKRQRSKVIAQRDQKTQIENGGGDEGGISRGGEMVVID